MRIGLVNTFDSVGGAARATVRLHKGFIKSGNQSTLFVQNKQSEDLNIVGPTSRLKKIWSSIIQRLDPIPLAFYPEREKRNFTAGWLSSFDLNNHSKDIDIFNLHWTAGGFQSINSISQIKKPLVLTLHDSWSYTGGCHVPFNCTGFENICGKCPQLHSTNSKDLSNRLLLKKSKLWDNSNMVVIGGSHWIADNAKRSTIFKGHRVEVVHPGLDLEKYKPLNKSFCREALGIDDNDKVILFGAVGATTDINKGFHLLIPALKKLTARFPDLKGLKLIIFGASSAPGSADIAIDTRYLGRLHDDISLSILYSAADITVVPSMQESFGQTASESFACGTPVVAFDTSGLKDIVDHQINGFLAKPFESDDLCNGIAWMLSDQERLSHMGIAARKKAISNFDIKRCVDRYLNIFDSIL